MPKIAKPGVPLIYRLWPTAAGATAFAAVLVGAGIGAAVARDFWSGFVWVASSLFVASVLANGMRVIAARHPSARNFAFTEDAEVAEAVVRQLERAELGFLALDAWDHLSRASMGGHRQEMGSLANSLRAAARSALERAPGAETVREFEAHVRALDAKLREDPK